MATGAASPPAVARALVGSALALKRDEHLIVLSWNHTLPWASAVVAEARRIGARPLLFLEDETAFWRAVDLARSTVGWTVLPRTARAALHQADALLYFPGPADRPRLRGLPSDLLAPLLGHDDLWLAPRSRTGPRRVRCLLGYASDPAAEPWGIPGAMWRSQLLRGISEADYPRIAEAGRRAERLLAAGRELRITCDDGTDVRLRLRRRSPWVDDGRVDSTDRRLGRVVATSPPGLVVVAVDERSATGTAVANRPSFLSGGRVTGGQWEMEGGRLRNYWYSEGGEAFEAEFAAAPRGRETVGLFALGLNRALAGGVPHAEDEEEGTVTLAIGGNSTYGGTNRCRYLSWLAIGGATVAVDGVPLCDRGQLL
jgi:leucyl aminopeptidase (aminopeptidase T)